MAKTRKDGAVRASHVPTTERASFGSVHPDPQPQPGLPTETAHLTSPVERAEVYDASGEDDGDDQEDDVQIPAGNAATSEWRSFVRAQHGPEYPGDVESASRDDLRDWYHEQHGGEDQEVAEEDVAAGRDALEADGEDDGEDDGVE